MKWILYTDGACRGNPGESAAGAVLLSPAGEKIPLKLYLGHKTNNQAEYAGLLLGLEKLKELKAAEIEIRADSQLMIRQLSGQYRVKNPEIKKLFDQAQSFLKVFSKVRFTHVPREENGEADGLANEALDERL